jgi:hypothetical protein
MKQDDTTTEPPVEEPWQRNRKLRLAQIEAEQEHGKQLADRYGAYGPSRPRFAEVKPSRWRRRRG